MKKTLRFLSIGLMAFGLMFTQSCDKCKDVECQHTGTCDKGVCTCPPNAEGELCETCKTGYEGDDCGTLMADKYVGTWTDSGSDDCATSSYSVTITKSSTTVDKILIANFGKYGCSGSWPTVEATVNGTQVTIASQSFCTGDQFTVSGSGSITSSGNQITLSYTGNKPPSDGTGTYSCNVTFTKQ